MVSATKARMNSRNVNAILNLQASVVLSDDTWLNSLLNNNTSCQGKGIHCMIKRFSKQISHKFTKADALISIDI